MRAGVVGRDRHRGARLHRHAGAAPGKRFAAPFFLDHVLDEGTEGCNQLLAADVELDAVDGLRGARLRRFREARRPGNAAPRPVEPRHRAPPRRPRPPRRDPRPRLAAAGAQAARRARLEHPGSTELEFILFDDSYEDGWRSGYRELTPANRYNADYSILGTGRVEPLLRRIRNEVAAAWPSSRRARPRPAGDRLPLHRRAHHLRPDYETSAKEIAAREDRALTFPLPLRGESGTAVLADGSAPGGMSPTMRHLLAGRLAALHESTLPYAPNSKSYKRFRPGSFAPTAVAWRPGNRTCAVRVVDHGAGHRPGCVLALSRGLGVQFAREGIRGSALCPGPVNTPLLKELFAKDPERAQRRLVHVPAGASPSRRRSRRSPPFPRATTRLSSTRPSSSWTAGSPGRT